MKFGMNMLLWTDNVTEVHRPILERLKTMGYDGVELPIFDLNPDKFAAIGLWLDDLGLERTAVTCRGVDDNPISPDRAIRERGIANNKLVLDCCQAAGATILAGPFHSALGHFSGSPPTADEWRFGVESMRPVAEHASKCGVTLAVEYLNRFETYLLNTAANTARFCREVEHPACRMMYDTFHANIEEKSISDAIRACAEMTVHVHISENDRSTPGRGHVAWDETFDTLKATGYDGWMTVEAFGLALPALAAATKIWRRMFDTEEQLARDSLAFMKREWSKRQ
ncbi:MAG TPA: sugar phosphate isomerase/epimerase family protein [Pirellulales bacterium]|nr:sugar phosphate isomerase/epimerase family protein [Pirellulales bacterium]